MSADNWTTCPKCKREAEEALRSLVTQLTESYGKVPVGEYSALQEKASQPLVLKETFREDYEFYGAEEGTVIASYSGECQKCGLALHFEEEHPIPGFAP